MRNQEYLLTLQADEDNKQCHRRISLDSLYQDIHVLANGRSPVEIRKSLLGHSWPNHRISHSRTLQRQQRVIDNLESSCSVRMRRLDKLKEERSSRYLRGTEPGKPRCRTWHLFNSTSPETCSRSAIWWGFHSVFWRSSDYLTLK